MQTELFRIETPEQFELGVSKAAALLAAGELVAIPTETVYGLAANALNEAAVQRIYEVKGRPSINPIIVHVDSLTMAQRCANSWPESAAALGAAFWPGPITLVLPKSEAIPPTVTAGGDTVGIRWPGHPFIRAVISKCGFPLAAPSANPSNQLSPTTGEHVLRALNGRIPLIIDAGLSNVGIESTVVDLTGGEFRVLRAGMISVVQIKRILQGGKFPPQTDRADAAVLKSPGLLPKHYSPRARLVVATWQNDSDLQRIIATSKTSPGKISIIAHEKIPQSNLSARVSVIPHDPEAYARALYAELHDCDELGVELILVEAVPSSEEWEGIRDRLTRASASH